MASLHVRNIDDEIATRLKERATRNGRSAEAEHREILKGARQWEKAPEPRDGMSWDERTARFRKSLEGRTFTPSEILLRESRDER